jgi:hypothetical protein
VGDFLPTTTTFNQIKGTVLVPATAPVGGFTVSFYASTNPNIASSSAQLLGTVNVFSTTTVQTWTISATVTGTDKYVFANLDAASSSLDGLNLKPHFNLGGYQSP